jgi:hypothetical protein
MDTPAEAIKKHQNAPTPKCPFCNVSPIRYAIVIGTTPGNEYALVQVFCADCTALLPVMAAPTGIQQPQEESPFGRRDQGIHPA